MVTLQTPVQQLVAKIHGQCAKFPRIGSAVQGLREVLGPAMVPRHCQATRPRISNRQMIHTQPGDDGERRRVGQRVYDPTLTVKEQIVGPQLLCLLQRMNAHHSVTGSKPYRARHLISCPISATCGFRQFPITSLRMSILTDVTHPGLPIESFG